MLWKWSIAHGWSTELFRSLFTSYAASSESCSKWTATFPGQYTLVYWTGVWYLPVVCQKAAFDFFCYRMPSVVLAFICRQSSCDLTMNTASVSKKMKFRCHINSEPFDVDVLLKYFFELLIGVYSFLTMRVRDQMYEVEILLNFRNEYIYQKTMFSEYHHWPSKNYFRLMIKIVFIIRMFNLPNSNHLSLQDRLQRCALDCQDQARDHIGTGASDADVAKARRSMEDCVAKCADNHINLLPNLVKNIKAALQGSTTTWWQIVYVVDYCNNHCVFKDVKTFLHLMTNVSK